MGGFGGDGEEEPGATVEVTLSSRGTAALQRREVTLAVLAPVCVTEVTKVGPSF